VIAERIGDITALVGPVGNRDPPIIRVRVLILNVLGDLVTLKPPERDLSFVPEHNDDTAASLVEQITGTSLEIVYTATGVVTVRALALETKGVPKITLWLGTVRVRVPRGGVGVQLAFFARTAVQRVLIYFCLIDVLNDINLMERIDRGSARLFTG